MNQIYFVFMVFEEGDDFLIYLMLIINLIL